MTLIMEKFGYEFEIPYLPPSRGGQTVGKFPETFLVNGCQHKLVGGSQLMTKEAIESAESKSQLLFNIDFFDPIELGFKKIPEPEDNDNEHDGYEAFDAAGSRILLIHIRNNDYSISIDNPVDFHKTKINCIEITSRKFAIDLFRNMKVYTVNVPIKLLKLLKELKTGENKNDL